MLNQHAGFNFSVFIAPIDLRGNFSSVSGFGSELVMEEYHEGGNFSSPVYVPTGMRYSNIVLQRGTVSFEPLSYWFTSVMAGMHLKYPMIITMMNENRVPVKIWTVLDTMPVKVDYSEMNALSGEVSITTIEMVHSEIIVVM